MRPNATREIRPTLMSPSVIELFIADARRFTSRLREALRGQGSEPDADAMRRAARRLHHGSLLADQESIARAAASLQKVALEVIAKKREWSPALRGRLGSVISAIDGVIDALPEGDGAAEARLGAALEDLDRETAGPGRPEPPSRPSAPSTDTTAAAGDGEVDAQIDALIDELGDAVQRLESDPRDREPLKSILRRIRRLRDIGQIQLLSPPDKALSAVEELILQIADLNATVGPGYLTVFRHAREVLEEMRAVREGAATPTGVGDHAVEVDRLKDRVMETARRARQVIWVSELFLEEGPHIVACPVADREAGSAERYFLEEAQRRLDRSEALREEMLAGTTEEMRLAGESLAHTLRHLRERAVAFGHPELGRITRRAAAALRAQLVRPPSRLRAMALGLGDVLTSLRDYVETDDAARRGQAIAEADRALQVAVLGGEADEADEVAMDPDRALQQALSLRTRLDDRLKRLRGAEAEGLREDLEQLFELVAFYLSGSTEREG